MSDRDYRTSEEVMRSIDHNLARIATALEGLLVRPLAYEERERGW